MLVILPPRPVMLISNYFCPRKLNRCGYKYGPDINNTRRHLDLYK